MSASAKAYFLLLLPLALHIFMRERERERESIEERDEKQKVKWELLLSVVPKRVDVISNMWLLGTLGYVESRMCGGEKISSGQ